MATEPQDRDTAAKDRYVTPEWLAAMIRNYVEEDEVLTENKAVIVQPPDDPTTVVVFQAGGNHLMIQVSAAEVVIS